jgi:DNA-binding Lrp family transcriptional regulator
MGRRGAGRRLSDQERMEILEIISRESKVKNVDLARRYGVSEGAIRKLKQVKDVIRDRYLTGNELNRDKRKRGGFARNAAFEQELYEWICRMRETQAYQLIPLTQTAVRQQAMVLAKKYDTMSNFKASPGWFARFCSRHRLDPPTPGVAAGGVAPAPGTQMQFQPLMESIQGTLSLGNSTEKQVELEVDLNCAEAIEQDAGAANRQSAYVSDALKAGVLQAAASVAASQSPLKTAKKEGKNEQHQEEIFSLGL